LGKYKKDVELVEHYKALDSFELRSAGWLSAPDNPVQFDFVTGLIESFLKDLEERGKLGNSEKSSPIDILRKTVNFKDLGALINQQYQKISGLLADTEGKTKTLEMERKKQEHLKRVHVIVSDKLDFKREKAFKRQNSYTPLLDDFVEYDERNEIKDKLDDLRRSFKVDRKPAKTVVKDCIITRFEADVYSSVAGS
jgi:hypothetical protein